MSIDYLAQYLNKRTCICLKLIEAHTLHLKKELMIKLEASQLTSFLNSLAKKFTRALSKSSPPKNVSPFVDLTSNTPF